MHHSSIAALGLFGMVSAFWRMPCRSRTGLGRLDPIVSPGKASEHVHAIHGGNKFGFNTTYNDLVASGCTSCGVLQDKSAYWTPPLLFMYPNGTTEVLRQVGGMLAYAFSLDSRTTDADSERYCLLFGDDIRAFPANFRMIAGDSGQRNFTLPIPDPPKSSWLPGSRDEEQWALRQKALGFNCLHYNKLPVEGSLERHFLPNKTFLDTYCVDGLRLELMFPSCWDGENVDSPDHRSHMAYSSLIMDGDCPLGFKTRLPSLFFETICDTYAYRGVEGRFVLGNGDPTGFGYHGDLMTDWDVGFLQSAIHTCTNPSGQIEDCPLFTLQSDQIAAHCTFDLPATLTQDNCAGPQQGLCGEVPVQVGPGYAAVSNASRSLLKKRIGRLGLRHRSL